jgi:hypothetical protein
LWLLTWFEYFDGALADAPASARLATDSTSARMAKPPAAAAKYFLIERSISTRWNRLAPPNPASLSSSGTMLITIFRKRKKQSTAYGP